MEIETFFKKYKRVNEFSTNNTDELFKNNEFKFDRYDVGVVSNINNNNKYEVFLYVEANNDIISGLLLKEFDSSFDSTEYFEELSNLAQEGNLDKIDLKINSIEVWYFFDTFLILFWYEIDTLKKKKNNCQVL